MDGVSAPNIDPSNAVLPVNANTATEYSVALALLAGVYAGFLALIEWATPGGVTIPWIRPVGGLDTLLSWGSLLLMLGLSVFLMVPVASAFSGLFLEDVAQAVEDPALPLSAARAACPADRQPD